MGVKSELIIKTDNTLEYYEEPVTEKELDFGVISGYWKSDGQGHTSKVEPFFYLSHAATVNVTASTYGSISVSLNLYNVTGGHAGPSFPQTGGSASLGPGQWRLYFTGSISTMKKSGIEVSVKSNVLKVPEEPGIIEDKIEEERGTQFKARATGGSRPQAVRIAYRRADNHAGGKPYKVLDERVYAEGSHWVCILTCELIN